MSGDWTSIRLGDACTKIGSGATPKGGKEVYLEAGPFSLIRSQNIYSDGFTRSGLAYIDEKAAKDLSNVEVLPGDILLNITGDSVARVCQVPEDVLPARVNQHVAIIRPDSNKLSARFIRYWLSSPKTQAHLLSLAAAGATRNALTKGMIENLSVAAPENISEQIAIAHIIGTLDDKIEINRKMNETLESMARALFKSWFIDFDPVRAKIDGLWKKGQSLPGLPASLFAIFPDQLMQAKIGELPLGWTQVKLTDLSDLNPETWSKSTRPVKINYVDLSNTKWGRIESITSYDKKEAPSRAQRILRLGDTIIGTVRPGNGSYALIYDDGLTGSTGFAVLRPKKSDFLEVVYLSATSKENIERLAHLADGGAYPAVRPEVVGATRFSKGPDQILTEFSKITQPILKKISQSEGESRELASIRDVLMPKLITGEVRIKDIEMFLKERGL